MSSVQAGSIRARFLPTVVTPKEIKNAERPAFRSVVMQEFVRNLSSPSPQVRADAMRLTTENCAAYGPAALNYAAVAPVLAAWSFTLPTIIHSGIPSQLAVGVAETSALNYIAMAAFNASVRAAVRR